MTTILDRVRRGESLADLEIVDIHGHIGRAPFPYPDYSPKSIVDVMDRIGVRSIVLSHTQCFSTHYELGNDEVFEAMQAFSGRILGYAIFWPGDAEAVKVEAQRRLDAGFVGVKLHNANGFPYTHENYAPALAAADERRMPVLLHFWGQQEELEQVQELAGRYPRANFILAHGGSANDEAYTRIAREIENVHFDVCCSLASPGQLARLVEGAGAEKVLWGSDCNFMSMPQQIGKVAGADIPDDVKIKLLSTNARRILDQVRR